MVVWLLQSRWLKEKGCLLEGSVQGLVWTWGNIIYQFIIILYYYGGGGEGGVGKY